MSKKLVLLFAVVFLSKFGVANAQVVINEFVSDPSSGSEWVELLNTSSSEISLTGWAWTELASPGTDTEHEGSPKNLSGTIGAGEVFVFEMASALNNGGDSIGLFEGTNLKDRVTFGKVNGYSNDLDAPAKGKSGALISGNWKTGQSPTKGASNPSSASSSGGAEEEGASEDGDEGESEGAGAASSQPKAKPKPPAPKKPKVDISSPAIAYVGVPFTLEGTGTGTDGEKLFHGRYYWNFGDGDSREVNVVKTEKFTHTYFYPDTYDIVFEHYPDSLTDVPDAASETTIKVIEPKVSISAVGDTDDFFVEIANETGEEADISGWALLSDQKVFTFPKNTVLSAKKKMIVSPKVSGFSVGDKNSLRLTTPQREVVSSYPLVLAQSLPIQPIPTNTASRNKVSQSLPPLPDVYSPVGEPPVGSLSALALESASPESSEELYSFSVMFISFLIFLGAGGGLAYYIRKRRIAPGAGGNFEILDE